MRKIGFVSNEYCVSDCNDGYIYDEKCFLECPIGTIISGSLCIPSSPSCSKVLELLPGTTLIEANNSMIEFDFGKNLLLKEIP